MKELNSLDSLSDLATQLSAAPVKKGVCDTMPLAKIKPDPKQPRKKHGAIPLQELVESIKAQGVLQPIVLRETPDPKDQMHIICYGERRYKASLIAGLSEIPYIFGDADPYKQYDENEVREGLTLIDKIQFILDRLKDGDTPEEIAIGMHKKAPTISKMRALAGMPSYVLDLWERGLTESVENLYILTKLSERFADEVKSFCQSAQTPGDLERIPVKNLKARLEHPELQVETPAPATPIQTATPELPVAVSSAIETSGKQEGGEQQNAPVEMTEATQPSELVNAAESEVVGAEATQGSASGKSPARNGTQQPRVLIQVGSEKFYLFARVAEIGKIWIEDTHNGVTREINAADAALLGVIAV